MLNKLLLFSGHTKRGATWSTKKKPGSVASRCGSLVKLKDIAQNSLPCVFTFGEGIPKGDPCVRFQGAEWAVPYHHWRVAEASLIAAIYTSPIFSFNFPNSWARSVFSSGRSSARCPHYQVRGKNRES